MSPNEGDQKNLVRNTKSQLGSKDKDGQRAESEKDLFLKQDKPITEEIEKQSLEQNRRCGKHLQKRILVVTYLSTSNLMGI